MNELTHLDKLEAESIYIIREVAAECEKPVMLYSIGKDSSVMLHLAMKAFYPEKPPFPFMHIDTTWKFREMIDFRDKIAEDKNIEIIVYTNEDGVKQGINPFDYGSAYTDIMKTQALKQGLDKYGFTAAFGGGRRDEEKSRAKERIFSFRNEAHAWDPKNQRPEMWNLYNTKIHFSGDEQIKSLVKYEVLNCKALKSIIVNNKTTEESESTIPIKQLMPVNSSGGQISRCVNVSSVRYMCKLGAQFLCTQLSNGKYGSLIGTLTTLKFFKEINLTIQDDDKRSILEYLKAHNKDVSTFDAVRESTRLASEILKLLNYDGSAIRFNSEAKREFERILITIDYLETLEINRIAEIFGDESFIIDSLSSDDKEIKEFLLKIFAKIISSRDIGKISWENDCYMTALMLLVLLKIEKWLIKYDAKYHSNCVNKINVIAAYFEEISETSLYNALVNSANSERSKAHDFVLKLQDERKKREKLDSEIVALKEEKRDFESIENRVRQHQTINIILAFSIVSILVFCLVIVLRAHYSNDNIYDFLMGLQPISIIFSVAAVIVVPFTIGTIYWKSNKKKSQSVKKESFWERIKKKFKRKK